MPLHPRHLIIAGLACLTLLGSPAIAQLTEDHEQLLQRERWVEDAYGLSLRPPKGVRIDETVRGDSLLVMTDVQNNFRIRLAVKEEEIERLNIEWHERPMTGKDPMIERFIEGQKELKKLIQRNRRSKTPTMLNVEQVAIRMQKHVKKQVLRDFDMMDADRHVFTRDIEIQVPKDPLEPGERRPPGEKPEMVSKTITAKHEGCWLWYRARPTKTETLAVGHAVVQLTPRLFVVMEMQGDWSQQQSLKRMFQAVFMSVEVADLREIIARRKAALERARKWRIEREDTALFDAITEDQYYRIHHERNELGYLRVRQTRVKPDGKNPDALVLKDGVQVTVNGHIVQKGATIDTLGKYYVSADDLREFWIVRTTRKPRGKGRTVTSVETGTRLGDRIQVKIESYLVGADGKPMFQDRSDQTYLRPPHAYLSQAESWMLARLLPNDVPALYHFYWYNADQKKMTMRSDRVVPTLGRFKIMTRPALYDQEITSVYSDKGDLIKRTMPNNVTIEPSTVESLKRVWKIR